MNNNEEQLYTIISFAKHNPNLIKMSNYPISFNKEYIIYDLNFNDCNLEEASLSNLSSVKQIIRNGLSIINSKSNHKYLQIVRKSLVKLNQFDPSLLDNKQNNEKLKKLYQEIINPCVVALNESSSLEIHKIININGIKIEVSYLSIFDAWIIALNNNSIVIKSKEDIDLIKTQKDIKLNLLKVCILWMELVENLSRENLLNELKEEMRREITLIGEYVGQDSIMKYPRRGIIFSSIVENNTHRLCLPTTESYEFFLKYKLNFSPIEKISTPIKNSSELFKFFREIHSSISISYLCDSEEGSVVNIVEKSKDGNLSQISMFQISTNEFLFFKKIYDNYLNLLKILTSSQNNNLNLAEETNIFKEKCSSHAISFLSSAKLPILDKGFYKTLSENISKNIINNLDNFIKGKRNFNDILEISIVECEKKLEKYYPGVVSKIFDNQHFNFKKQNNLNSEMSYEKQMSFSNSSSKDSSFIQQSCENKREIKISKQNVSSSLSFDSEKDDLDKSDTLKKASNDENKLQLKSTKHEDAQAKYGEDKMAVLNQETKLNRRKSNSGTIRENNKLEINSISTHNNFTYGSQYNNQKTNNKTTKNFMTESKIIDEHICNTFHHSSNTKNRKDFYGTPIIKKSKRHKLTFRDQKGMKFIFQVQVESFKRFNILNKHNEESYSNESSKISCCVLI